MKSLLFCTSYVGDPSAWRTRYQRWIDFYQRHDMGAEQLLLLDDASPNLSSMTQLPCLDAERELDRARFRVQILRFQHRLGKSTNTVYPGWWRSFTHSATVARALGANKLIHVESDALVLSDRLRDHIASLRQGWHVLWCPKHGMPETAIQVICEDQFDALAAFGNGRWEAYAGQLAENVLPFTQVSKQFKGDRYSEMRRYRGMFRSRKFDRLALFQQNFFWHPIPRDADFAAQVEERQWQRSPTLQARART